MNVFNNQYTSASVWDMQGAIIRFGSGDAATIGGTANARAADYTSTIIAMQVNLTYSRTIAKRYPINISKAIYMMGVPTGTLAMGLLFGPNNYMTRFFQIFGARQAQGSLGGDGVSTGMSTGVMSIKPFGQTSSGAIQGEWRISDAVITSVSLQIQGSDGNSQIPAVGGCTMEFNKLEIDDTNNE